MILWQESTHKIENYPFRVDYYKTIQLSNSNNLLDFDMENMLHVLQILHK